MAQIKVLDLDNACSLSELSSEDINSVKGGYLATLALTRRPEFAQGVYWYTFAQTGSVWAARTASLSTRA
jgi:hypothetical protein